MPHPLVRAASLVAVLSSAALAQMAPVPFTVEPYVVDSGYLHNPNGDARVVFATEVSVPGDGWMQVIFADTNLPAGSRLRLTSKLDGAVQWFDAHSLRDYQGRSASFNGHSVLVELIAGPHTRANRMQIVEVVDGDPMAVVPASICGTTDDRVPSNDPRQGREWPIGCTSWLINATTFLSAGHCNSGSPQQVHFNCPLSSASGTPQLPPPSDQYAIDTSTLRSLNSGIGADWAVVSAVRNSNTGLYPGQKQGFWYNLGPVPSPAGNHIRITGYGTTSFPISPTWNQAQKTHVGTFTGASSTSLQYRTDSTGGNSGSPVIHEETGNAIGIHTHAGCSVGGGSNNGTRIDRADLVNAIAAVQGLRVAGLFQEFGTGCTGSAGVPRVSSSTFPDLGNVMTIDVTGVAPGQLGTLFFGSSSTTWGAIPLPVPLDAVGFTGCSIYVSLDSGVPLATGAGAPSLGFTIPNTAALIGSAFYVQYACTDPLANPGGAVLSNGAKITIGD